MRDDNGFVPALKPTLVVTATSGSVKVTRKCYTPVIPEVEQRSVQHRADQLNLAKPDKPIERMREVGQYIE